MEKYEIELLKELEKAFEVEYAKSSKIRKLTNLLANNKATYLQAHEYAKTTGGILAKVFEKHLTFETLKKDGIYEELAKAMLNPSLKKNHMLISDFTVKVQELINKKYGIGIKGIKPIINEDRINNLAIKVSESENLKEAKTFLDEPVKNFSMSVVDELVKANAEFQAQAGLEPQIKRTAASDCCDWCEKLAGTYKYDYPNYVPEDVFRRHRKCECLVEYLPGDGTRQNSHSKVWTDSKGRIINK